MTAGVEGLLRDKTRRSRIPRLGTDLQAKVVEATLGERAPGETTHWTAAAMVKLQATA